MAKTSVEQFTKHPVSWTDLIDDPDQKSDLDLPRDLALLDIEPSLPKLSSIPSGSS